MALVLLDGLEDLTTWTPSTASAVSTVPARYRNGLRLTSSGDVRYQFLPAFEADTVTVGVAFKASSLAIAFNVLSLWSDTGVTEHVRIVVNTNGSLNLNRATTGLVASAAGVVTVDTWLYLEVQAKLSDTAGFITARINGTQVAATATTVDTKNAGTKTVFDHLRLAAPTAAVDFDDFYLKTGAGDLFTGSVTVETLYPTGNGDANAWTRHDGVAGANWTAVDELPATTDDYVYDTPAVLTEPFDNLTAFAVSTGWSSVSGGRTGNCGQSTTVSNLLAYSIPAAMQTDKWTVGFAVKLSGLTATERVLVSTRDSGAFVDQDFYVMSDGTIRAANIGGSTSYTSAPGVITAGVWAYVECQVYLHASAGSIIVRVNGTPVITQTGIDTLTSATKFDQVRFNSGGTASITTQLDDFYFRNDLVFQGDPLPGGRQDLYALGDLVHADGTIVGVCHSAYSMRSDSVTARTIKLVSRRTADTKSAARPLSASWRTLDYCLPLDPEVVPPGALVLTEPFIDFTTNAWSNIASATIVAGRTGTAAQIVNQASGLLIYTLAAAAQTAQMTVGFAFQISNLAAGNDRELFEFRGLSATIQQFVFVQPDGAIRVQNPATGSYVSAVGLIPVNTWRYLEVAVNLHDTAGSIVVRVDGTVVINVSGIDARSGSSTAFDQLRIATNRADYTVLYDDLYLRNDLVFQGDPTAAVPVGTWTLAAVNALQSGVEST